MQAEIATRDQVPVEETWDLTTIYGDDAAWDADAARAREQLVVAAAHRGALGESPGRLRQALDDSMALRQTIERLYVYAKLRLDEDIASSDAQARLDRATALSIEAGEALAFFEPEVLAMPEEQLAAAVADPALATYAHALDDLKRQRPHTRSIEVEELLAQSADVARGPRETFSALDNADLDYGTVRDDEGREVALTKGRYQLLLESKNRGVRRDAYDRLMATYLGHKHTLASLHAASVRKDVFYAKARRHDSARAAALHANNVPIAVYDSLIAATRESQPAIRRYMDLRKRILGLDELAIYDLYVPLAATPERHYTYREAIDLVLDGVAPLGERYVDDLRRGFESRWVDVRETKGKRSGAYSWGAYGRPPVMLMNWNGSLDHVFTLAHEAGHAMHSFYADAAQPFHDAQYSIFVAEIASTLNEVLLTWHLLAELPDYDTDGRFAILNRFADSISTTLVRQVMFAEFEQRTHELVERGEPLTLDTLNEMYGDVLDAYVPGVVNDEAAKQNWSRIPHFYGAFYVFQYATGISAGIALARAIRDQGAPAAERYLEMLRGGGSDYPLEILKRAGVDLTSPEPVRAALAEFDATVREMESLLGASVG